MSRIQVPAGPPKLLVFGGRGFVGSAVCKEALKTGLHVVSITPSGQLGQKLGAFFDLAVVHNV